MLSRWLAVPLVVALALTAALIVAIRPIVVGEERPCGSSRPEALARGCRFDVMSFCWLPAACDDAELTADFLARANRTWYLDAAGARPLGLEDVRGGAHAQLYVAYAYHVSHCLYMWKKLHRAVDGHSGIDTYIGDYAHTEHCERMLLDQTRISGDALNTIISTKFPGCRPRRGFW